MCQKLPSDNTGAKCDNINEGTNIIEPLKVAKKSTGITALLFNDHFLETS